MEQDLGRPPDRLERDRHGATLARRMGLHDPDRFVHGQSSPTWYGRRGSETPIGVSAAPVILEGWDVCPSPDDAIERVAPGWPAHRCDHVERRDRRDPREPGGHGRPRRGRARRRVAGRQEVRCSFVPRTVGRRAPNNVRRLAARKPTVRPVRSLPLLGRTTGAAPGPSGQRPEGGARRRAGPGRRDDEQLAIRRPSPASTGSADRATPFNDGEPPDPWVAVGPEHVVQTRQPDDEHHRSPGRGSARRWRWPTSSCCRPTSRPTTPTPHVIYDSLHGRWMATEVSWDCDTSFGGDFGTGYIDFADLADGRPERDLEPRLLLLAGPAPRLPRARHVDGQDRDRQQPLQHDPGGRRAGRATASRAPPSTGRHVYMDWADLIERRGVRRRSRFRSGDCLFEPRVAVQVPATSPALQAMVLATTTGAGATRTRSTYLVGRGRREHDGLRTSRRTSKVTASWPRGSIRPSPTRTGPDTIDSAVDRRPTDAHLAGRPALVTGRRIRAAPGLVIASGSPSSGPTGVTMTVRPTLNQDFLVQESGKDLFMGGVGLAGNGTLHVGLDPLVASGQPIVLRRPPTIGDAANSISRPSCSPPGRPLYGRAAGATTWAWPRTRRSRTRSGTPTNTPAVRSG